MAGEAGVGGVPTAHSLEDKHLIKALQELKKLIPTVSSAVAIECLLNVYITL